MDSSYGYDAQDHGWAGQRPGSALVGVLLMILVCMNACREVHACLREVKASHGASPLHRIRDCNRQGTIPAVQRGKYAWHPGLRSRSFTGRLAATGVRAL